MPNCWICGKPSVWRVTGIRDDRTPVVYVQFFACDKCVPFALVTVEKKEEATK